MPEQTDYFSISNSSVFITGGATGIGAALVQAFCAQGARVGFVDFNNQAANRLIIDLEENSAYSPWFRAIDITSTDELQAAIQDFTKQSGGLNTLINSAANDMRQPVAEVTPKSWRETMAINLDATFFSAQAAAASMKESGGSIINFSSINTILGPANMTGYVAAKSAIVGLTKSMAREHGHLNIRVNAILPGWVVTDKQLDRWLTPDAETQWMDEVALKSRLMPDDVAKLALFLASDDSRMITGQSLVIDGGRV